MSAAGQIQVQVVGRDGTTITERPVNLEDLIARHSQSVDIGNGVHVVVGRGGDTEEDAYGGDDWAVIDDLQKASALGKEAEQRDGNAEVAVTGKVAIAEWTAVAPPQDSKVDYTKMEALDITPSAKKYHPIPLTFHSMTSYTDGVSANRLLVYGGRNARGDEQNEVYEFTLATSSWRRIETHQPQCNGVFAHATALHGTQFYTLGGFGTGGTPIPKASLQCQNTLKRYELIVSEHRKPPASPHTFGILPLLQQLNLARFTWRSIPLGHQLHLAAHTLVSYNGMLYAFGGVDERMQVTNNLIAINPLTGEVRLLRREGPAPKPRCMHTAVLYHDWMIVYGGSDANNEVLGDVWAFNFVTEAWEEMPAVGGTDRFGHSCCLMGSRMIVTGGYGGWIDDEGAAPAKTVLELNLNPIKDQFLWKSINVKNAAEYGIAFGASAPTGSGTSLITFGGMVLKGGRKNVYEDADVQSNHSASSSATNTPRKRGASKHKKFTSSSEPALVPCGDVGVIRFRDKPKPNRSASSARRETLSGDPNELPASTKAFLKRQDDFIVKKNKRDADVEEERTLRIQESADANLYLKPEEVDEILAAADKAIDHLGSYDMLAMPDTVPDKAKRVSHVDESKGLLRQTRDVLKSMIPKPTTGHVKSKTHRKMEGAPEEHGGAKPFRRVKVMDLVGQVRRHLSDLNKLTFGNYKWEKKDEYLAFAHGCERVVNSFVGTMNRIRDSYIQYRLKSIQEDGQRHETVMSRLKAKIEATRNASRVPTKSVYKGKQEKDFDIPLEKASVIIWRKSLNKTLTVLKAFGERCAQVASFVPVAEEGHQPSYLYGHTSRAASVISPIVASIHATSAAFVQTELPPDEKEKEVIEVKASYKRFSTYESTVVPLLASIEAQTKILAALVLTTTGEATKGDKDAGSHRDKFVNDCGKAIASCRGSLQTLSASFLSYVPPKVKHADPHTHQPKINAQRTSSLAARAASRTSPLPEEVPQRIVVAVSNHTKLPNGTGVMLGVTQPPPPHPQPEVKVLAEPLHTSFDANTSHLQMPSWNGPFSQQPARETLKESWQPPINQFDFFQGVRPSAPASVNQSAIAFISTSQTAAHSYQQPNQDMQPNPTTQTALPSVVDAKSESNSQPAAPTITAIFTVPAVISAPTPPPAPAITGQITSVASPLSAVGGVVPNVAPNAQEVFNPYGPNASQAAATQAFQHPYSLTHTYAAAQPYHVLNASLPVSSRPHTPAQCPGTPFHIDQSKDRGMFKGKLTPGERSILMNRQMNTMW